MKTHTVARLALLALSASSASAAEFSYSTVINLSQGTRYSGVPALSCNAQVAAEINVTLPEKLSIVSVRGIERNNSRFDDPCDPEYYQSHCETRVELRGAQFHAVAFETGRSGRDFLLSNSADLPIALTYSYPYDGRCDGAIPAQATAQLALGTGEMAAQLRSRADIRFAINSFSGAAQVNAQHASADSITLQTPIELRAQMHWNASSNRGEGVRGFVQF